MISAASLLYAVPDPQPLSFETVGDYEGSGWYDSQPNTSGIQIVEDADRAHTGTHFLSIPGGKVPVAKAVRLLTRLETPLDAANPDRPYYVDFWIKPVAELLPDSFSTVEAHATITFLDTELAVIRVPHDSGPYHYLSSGGTYQGVGALYYCDKSTSPATWIDLNYHLPLAKDGRSCKDWLRITTRHRPSNLGVQTDLFVNGLLIHSAPTVVIPHDNYVWTAFASRGTAAVLVDDLQVTSTDPLPAWSDDENDFIEDIWEIENGFSNSQYDRDTPLVWNAWLAFQRARLDASQDAGFLDTDADGMPDYWEDQFELDKNAPSDGGWDFDRDGLTNLDEFHRGTTPNSFPLYKLYPIQAPKSFGAHSFNQYSVACDLSEIGAVTGMGYNDQGFARPWLWQPGYSYWCAVPSTTISAWVCGVNSQNAVITMISDSAFNGRSHAWLLAQQGVAPVRVDPTGVYAGSHAWLNDANDVLGTYHDSNWQQHLFLRQNGGLPYNLATPSGAAVSPLGFNLQRQILIKQQVGDYCQLHLRTGASWVALANFPTNCVDVYAELTSTGEIIGGCYCAGDSCYRAFLWQAGVFTLLPVPPDLPGGTSSLAIGMNALGEIGGYISNWDPVCSHVCLWKNGQVRLLDNYGDLGINYIYPLEFNPTGEILAYAEDEDGYPHSLLYKYDHWVNLETRVQKPTTWHITELLECNDLGQILVSGFSEQDSQNPYALLRPMPDTDGDGLADDYEITYGLNPYDSTDAIPDLDADGLSAEEEFLANTDPANADSDHDNMPDGWEYHHGTDPTDLTDAGKDFDGDKLTNLQEYHLGTEPCGYFVVDSVTGLTGEVIPTGLNNFNEVTGIVLNFEPTYSQRGFFWRSAADHELLPFLSGVPYCYTRSINDQSNVLGGYTGPSFGFPIVWNPDLGILSEDQTYLTEAGAYVLSLNNSNSVLGVGSHPETGNWVPFRFTLGDFTSFEDLSPRIPPGYDWASFTDQNDLGDLLMAAGSTWYDASAYSYSYQNNALFLPHSDPTQAQLILLPNTTNSYAEHLTNAGTVFASGWSDQNQRTEHFLFNCTSNTATELSFPFMNVDDFSTTNINESGSMGINAGVPYLYRHGHCLPLSRIAAAATGSGGIYLVSAVAINNEGTLLCRANNQGQQSFVLIKPNDDTDDDGLPDDWEQLIIQAAGPIGGTLLTISDIHAEADFDGDGWTNGQEFSLGKDPAHYEDSDLDHMSDAYELAHGLDPHDPTDFLKDLDGDGILNGSEFIAQVPLAQRVGTHYAGAPYPWTTQSLTLDPHRSATEGDPDDDDWDDIRNDWERFYGFNPNAASDADDDPDGDQLPNLFEFIHRTNPRAATDRDSDSMSDLWELLHSLNPLINDGELDPDGDGAANYSEFIAGTDPQDTNDSPFAVVACDPPVAAIGYPLNIPILVYFNKELPSTLPSQPVQVHRITYQAGAALIVSAPIAGTTTVLPGRRAIAFVPSANLLPGPRIGLEMNYHVELNATTMGIPSTAPFSNYFSTVPDLATVGPWFSTIWPAEGAWDVFELAPVVVQWSEPLALSCLNSTNARILDANGNAQPIQVDFDYSTNRLALTPTAPLPLGAEFTVHLTTGLCNLKAVPLLAGHTWKFTTRKAPDPLPVGNTAPFIQIVTPANFTQGISPGTQFTVTFSEALLPSTLQQPYLTLADADGIPMPCTVSYNTNTFTASMIPLAPLQLETAYRLRVDSTLKAAAAPHEYLVGNGEFTYYTIPNTVAPQQPRSVPVERAAQAPPPTNPNQTNTPAPSAPAPVRTPHTSASAPAPKDATFSLFINYGNGLGACSVIVEITRVDGTKQTRELPPKNIVAPDVEVKDLPIGSSITITPVFAKTPLFGNGLQAHCGDEHDPHPETLLSGVTITKHTLVDALASRNSYLLFLETYEEIISQTVGKKVIYKGPLGTPGVVANTDSLKIGGLVHTGHADKLVLVPVEVKQPTIGLNGAVGALASVQELRFCRWNSPHQGSLGNLASPEEFPKDDPDRIIISIPLPGKIGAGTLKIHVSTTGAANTPTGTDDDYNDEGADVDLIEKVDSPGVFESKPIALVADKDDDTWQGGRGAGDGAQGTGH